MTAVSGGHTPGPWVVDDAGDIVSGPYNVCIPYATKPEDKALMAAAPDLLAALENVLDAYSDACNYDMLTAQLEEAAEAARAAIARTKKGEA